MKKCAVISLHANNEFKKKLIRGLISTFKSKNIDVILISSDHIEAFEGVSNYITAKNVSESRYLAQEMTAQFMAGPYLFERYEKSGHLNYATYFIKLYQTAIHYSMNLGYDFMYYIEYDCIINEKHHDVCFSDKLDANDAYFYNWITSNACSMLFFYGGTHALANVFSDQNLKKLETYCIYNLVLSIESSAYHLLNFSRNISYNIIVNQFEYKDVFHKANLVSDANVAEVYFNEQQKAYYFLMAKGDIFDSTFSAQVYMNNNLIFNKTISQYLNWHSFKMENDTNYSVLYYNGENIDNDHLSRTTNIYTDTNNIVTNNRFIIR